MKESMPNSARSFKDSLYEQFALIGKAVSSPKRIELLDLLSHQARTVEVLANETGMSVANTSQHLQILRNARLVESRKVGQYITYSVAGLEVCEFLTGLRMLAGNRLARIEQLKGEFLQEKDIGKRIDIPDLVKKQSQGKITLLDVRPSEEYTNAHIPGAISIPLDELNKRLDEVPRKIEVVVYCRGPSCMMAIEAVNILRNAGYEALWMEDSVHEWKRNGRPLKGLENYLK